MPVPAPDAPGARVGIATAMEEIDGIVASVAGLSDRDLVESAREAEALGRLVDAIRVRIAGEVDARSASADGGSEDARLSARCGCRNAVELLERATGASSRVVLQRIRLARHTRARSALSGGVLPAPFPAVAEALDAGTLGEEAARYVSDELARVKRCGSARPEEVAAAEQELIAEAAAGAPASTFGELKIMTDTWVAFLDRDGIEPDAEQASRRRKVVLGRARDGLIPIHGDLMPEVAAGLARLFEAYAASTVRFAPDPEETGDSDESWSDDTLVDTRRTVPQMRHDALAAIIQTAASSAETPTLGGAAPTLVVTTTADDLDGGVARIDGVDVPLPASMAHRIACTGAVQKMVFDSRGRLVRLGSRERLFNAHQRRAIAARDGGCVIPGCSIPASWCEVHHVEEHSRGGPTHTDNGVLLCWWHHHHIERADWRIEMRRGVPYVCAPRWIDGRRQFRPVRRRARVGPGAMGPPT
ncbi:MAG: DUF222 domain-containing protein [Microbacterium sp.]